MAKILTVSRKRTKILTVNRKSHYPIETLIKEVRWAVAWKVYSKGKGVGEGDINFSDNYFDLLELSVYRANSGTVVQKGALQFLGAIA